MRASAGVGLIELNGMLHDASTPLSVDQLAGQGIKRIRVISPGLMDELVNRSIRTIVDKYRFTASPGNGRSLGQIEAESKTEFQELLRQYQLRADVTSAVERSRQALAEEPQLPQGDPGTDGRETWMLRRRIEKLTAHIAAMEAALRTLSSAGTFSNQHVQNLLRDLGVPA